MSDPQIPDEPSDQPPDGNQSDFSRLISNQSFLGLNVAQFLGAFNDNFFKQLVLLLCVDRARAGDPDRQAIAMFLFAFPFILLSGFAGFLSDRFSKRTIIVLCKVAEILIVVCGMIGFLTGSLSVLLGVLCLMGIHSAFFGPSKYGILPELLPADQLPRANGVMLMATFLAIILGLAAAGMTKQQFSQNLWLASLPCLVVASLGLASSLLIRPLPPAEPRLKFEWSSLGVAPETRRLLGENRSLWGVLLMSAAFWFVGGTVYPPAINTFGKEQLHLGDDLTGIMAASTGLGIAVGCILAGILSKDRVQGWLVRAGAWGLTLSLAMLCIPGPGYEAAREEVRARNTLRRMKAAESTSERQTTNSKQRSGDVASVPVVNQKAAHGSWLGMPGSTVALIAVGLFAGFYSVPLQVYVQSATPPEQKGRIVGAFNLLNWIGIAGASVVYSLGRWLLMETWELPASSLFGLASLLMLPVALFYRPPDATLKDPKTAST